MARYRNMPVTENVGTPATGVTAETFGFGDRFRTVLTVSKDFGAIAGGANLGLGVLLFTFPAGDIMVEASKLNIALQQTEDNVTADTPDIGLGTTVASGAVAVLGGTAAFENIHTGQTAADCDGTATVNTLGTQLVIEAADSHAVYLNIADGWAAGGDAALGASGEVVLIWTLVD